MPIIEEDVKPFTHRDSFRSAPNLKLSTRWALSVALVIWVAMPLLCWSVWGIDELEDWLTKNVMPVGLLFNALWLGGAVCLWKGCFRLAAAPLLLAVAVALGANPTLGQWLMSHHEARYATRGPGDFAQPFDAIVVLGGCSLRLPEGRAEVNSYGQRIVSTAEFWHAQKTDWIIATGGVAADGPNEESAKNADLLVSLGVPVERIVRAPGRNTRDEMRSLQQLLSERSGDFPNNRIGLVTCAFHLPRAMRLAARHGLELVPLPSGHRAVAGPWKPSDLVPDANALLNNSLLMKEWLAGVVGR